MKFPSTALLRIRISMVFDVQVAKTIPAEKIPDLDKSEDSANGNWSDWSPSHHQRVVFFSWTSVEWMNGVTGSCSKW